jgi:uncharacterized protein YbjT (DUF2867 family)
MLLVTGASGNVGAEVVQALAAAGQEVRALTRSDRPAGLAPAVQGVAGDLNRPESLTDAFAGVQGVFLLPGYEDMEGVLAVMRGAGVERVVLLSGSSAQSGVHDPLGGRCPRVGRSLDDPAAIRVHVERAALARPAEGR